jgi:nondiscriminating aspartyl-tRNA synthetase
MSRIKTWSWPKVGGVCASGWLHQFRELGRVNFLIVRDGWGTAQAVVEDAEALGALRAAQVESIVEVTGPRQG